MSSPSFVLELSESAQSDFRDILSHTWQHWGERQLDAYREAIDSALRAVAANPLGGSRRIETDYRFVRAGRHLIFYRIIAERIVVVRILHARMDLDARLDEAT